VNAVELHEELDGPEVVRLVILLSLLAVQKVLQKILPWFILGRLATKNKTKSPAKKLILENRCVCQGSLFRINLFRGDSAICDFPRKN
jgi:hypothetical protein